MIKVQRYKAFTLAEVLITLGVIGIIAALTIPTLMKNYQKMQYYTAFQKGYAEVTLIVQDLVLENGDMAGAISEYGGLTNAFKAKVKNAKFCENGTMVGECMSSDMKHIDGQDDPPGFDSYDRLTLMDGVSMAIQGVDDNCEWAVGNMTDACGAIYMDTNGIKRPNQLGRDMFFFMLTNKKLVPYGAPGSGIQEWLYWYCNPDITDPNSGVSCAQRLLQDGKMDY